MKRLILFVVAAIGLATSACSSHPTRVNCEAHLQPINAPAPVKEPRS